MEAVKLQPGLESGRALMAQGEAAFHDFVVNQLEPALGRELPQMEVRCKNLSLIAEEPVVHQDAGSSTTRLPSVYNSVKHVTQSFTASRYMTQKRILNRVDAVFEPGTITLVLGQPGSGNTSLMKVLSGQFPLEKNITLEGEISYNGQPWKELLSKLPQLAAYVPQSDKYFPSLSVQETLEFAHACCEEEVASKRGKTMLSNGTTEQNKAALREYFLSNLILEYKRYDIPTGTVASTSNVKHPKSSKEEVVSYVEVVTPRSFSNQPVQNVAESDQVDVDLHREQNNACTPITLAFKDLWYSVPLPHHKHDSINLLKGIGGYALPGTMTALMGSSGAGKTTLLDVIAGRKSGGNIQGEILVNGYPATDLAIRRCTGYCEQQDIHSEGATIREALTFSAFLVKTAVCQNVPSSRLSKNV